MTCHHRLLILLSCLAMAANFCSLADAQGVIQSVPAQQETSWNSPAFWETIDGRDVTKHWEFSDSEIRLVKPAHGGNSLLSGPLPANFELSWSYKIEKNTNSGVKYRVRRFGGQWLGLEYQIIDALKAKSGKTSNASIYDLVAAANNKTVHPVGEWNQARVKVQGHKIEHYLNGDLVAKLNCVGVRWDTMHAKSKFGGRDGFAQPADGDRIMLTDHGGKVAYKDFRFTELKAPENEITKVTTNPPFLGNGMRNSWADQNSIVMWTRTTKIADMISDGPKFKQLDRKQASQLSKSTDETKIHAAQLPEGTELNEMLGACPGAVGQVRLTYFPRLQSRNAKSTEWVTTRAKDDFTAQWKIQGLSPGKEYAAVIEARPVDGGENTAVLRGAFRTAPAKNKTQDIKFCVTTCHDFIRRDDGMNGHKIYPAMTKMKPNFIVHAGDIEYYDKPNPWAMTIPLMRYKWGRIFSLPNNREFYSNTTTYFMKDDHDTLKNDCWEGQTYGSVSFEQGVRLFNDEQFPSKDKRYQTVMWGKDLQIWLLEGRDYRSSNRMPDGPEKTILGQEQKAWLLKTLDDSKAKFKLVFSPTPIVGPDRNNKNDNHANDVFTHEGNQLREAFAKVDGLIVFCGDRHWQYASVDPDTKLWEFGCGPGSEKHQFGWNPGDQRPQHKFLRVAGGYISGHLKKKSLTIRHHKVNGEQVSEFKFPN